MDPRANLYVLCDPALNIILDEVKAASGMTKRNIVETLIANAAGLHHPAESDARKAWRAYKRVKGLR